MRKTLDKMFGNTKLSVMIPLLTALVLYVLFVVFGTAEDKTNILIRTPVGSAIWFWSVFFIIFIQIKNASCPEWFLNVFELFVTVFPGISTIINIVSFFIGGCQNGDLGIFLGLVTYSAVSFAHSKRAK